jgi:hypothetical protein
MGSRDAGWIVEFELILRTSIKAPSGFDKKLKGKMSHFPGDDAFARLLRNNGCAPVKQIMKRRWCQRAIPATRRSPSHKWQ